MSELLHLETVRDDLEKISNKLSGQERSTIHDMEELLNKIERVILAYSTEERLELLNELEEWAR